MPKDGKEPQSYGSGADWVTGKTGQEVNDQDAVPPAEHQEFYDSSRSERAVPNAGGATSDAQRAESSESGGETSGTSESIPRITTAEGGAKRDSFFKKRDYDS